MHIQVLVQRVNHLAALAEVSPEVVVRGGAAAHPDLLALASPLVDKKTDDAMQAGYAMKAALQLVAHHIGSFLLHLTWLHNI